MTDSRDLSRLPRDQAYWDALASRISDRLGPQVRGRATAAAAAARWWSPTSGGAWAAGGLAIAAALALVMLVPARGRDGLMHTTGLLRAPVRDPVMLELVASPTPPPLGLLVVAFAGDGP